MFWQLLKEESMNESHKKGKGILLVDDDDLCLMTTQRILVGLGYRVTQACDSLEALKVFRNQPEKFDLIITDLQMPETNGHRLAVLVHEINKDIPVIICSGSERDLCLLKEQGLENSRFLLKPFSKDQLVEAMTVLGAGPD
mgnify:CR=1 FL=1